MHSAIFQAISSSLQRHRALWQISPFECHDLPWRDDFPGLAQGLERLNEAEIAHLVQDEAAAQSWFAQYVELIDTSSLNWLSKPRQAIEPPFWLLNGVKGRKSEQIAAFAAQLPRSVTHWLEWCAGKGHLGRVAQYHTQQPITSIEWQSTLCHHGQAMADQLRCQQQFVQADVLNDNLSHLFNEAKGVMALHACGQLHLELLEQARQHQIEHIFVCPCCYHLISDSAYLGLSEQAKAVGLTLSKRDLKLPLQQLVTSGQRGRRQRETELLWRLSFSQYVQLLTGESQYTPLPNFAKALLNQDYEAFCRWACQAKGYAFNARLMSDSLVRGQGQLALVNTIELVRQRFRRLLELWLVLDRVCFLEEAGYQVSLMAFCDFSVTPRNLLIKAQLAPLNT